MTTKRLTGLRRSLFAAWICVLTISFAVRGEAQNKWYSTPKRDGVSGAKGQAMLNAIMGELQRMNNCTAQGRMYAPTSPITGTNGCAIGISLLEDGVLRLDLGHLVSGFPNGALVLDATSNGSDGGIHFRHLVTPDDVTSYTEHMTITRDGQVGIGRTTPLTRLDVAGAIRIGGEAETCASSKEGAIRYNVTSKTVEFCDGIAWNSLGVPAPSLCRGDSKALQWDGVHWDCVDLVRECRVCIQQASNSDMDGPKECSGWSSGGIERATASSQWAEGGRYAAKAWVQCR